MRKITYLGILGLLILFTGSAYASDGGYGFIYGQNHLYALSAPKGWVLDNQIGKQAGIQAMFYRKGEGIAQKYTYMYTNISQLGNDIASIQDQIKYSEKTFRKDDPALNKNLKVRHLKDIKKNGKLIEIYNWEYGTRKEAVAYVKEKYVIVMIIMTAPGRVAYKKNYPAFIKLVDSYRFITSDVLYRSLSKKQFKRDKALYDNQMKHPEVRKYVKNLNKHYLNNLMRLAMMCKAKLGVAEDFQVQITINKIGIPNVIYWTPSKIGDCMYNNGMASMMYPQLPKHYKYIQWYNRFTMM